MSNARMIGILGAAALLSAMPIIDPGMDGEGPPRRDRHAKRLKVEPTEHTRSKNKSTSLKKLLRK